MTQISQIGKTFTKTLDGPTSFTVLTVMGFQVFSVKNIEAVDSTVTGSAVIPDGAGGKIVSDAIVLEENNSITFTAPPTEVLNDILITIPAFGSVEISGLI